MIVMFTYDRVPRQNIQGRIYFCYWPLRRFGFVQ
jgi:hypothetical protein